MHNPFIRWLNEHFHFHPTPNQRYNICKKHFQNSDRDDSEDIQLCKFFVEIKNCYGTDLEDVGLISNSN